MNHEFPALPISREGQPSDTRDAVEVVIPEEVVTGDAVRDRVESLKAELRATTIVRAPSYGRDSGEASETGYSQNPTLHYLLDRERVLGGSGNSK
ncbi:MAG TPA: hypothetical protein VMR18_02510 [Candidatus Saccharimonadales bacterium]|jgi:hypothetical protein|nr:hypothetical protein [Candidatus Saccharimonadales bacterium]